jgi:tetratricopeptide (TPR) repeat protein
MRYEEDGTGTREESARIHVLSAAGLSVAGQLIFNYNSDNETIEVRSVRVLKPDGTAVPTGPDNVQDLSAPVAREAPMYTDAKQKHVTVAGLAVGETLEYDVVTTSKPLLAGQFWHIETLDCNAVCLDREIELNVPAHRRLNLKSPKEAQPTIHTEADRRIYVWNSSTQHVVTMVDLLKNYKPSITSLLEGSRPPIPRRIMFSTFQSWSDVGSWYASLERDRRVPTPEIRSMADDITKGKAADLDKAQALYDWVSRNIRYVSLSFGIGRIQPHAASEVLANRYGDCKDKTTLLEAMLDAEGLRAEAAIVNTAVDIDADVPTPEQFDHALTHVSVVGQDHWLDSTVGVAPFDYLLPQLRGKSALVVFLNKPPAIVETPRSLPIPTTYDLSVEGTVNDDAKLDATIKLETRGDLEVLIRLLFTRITPAQVEAAMEEGMKQVRTPAYEMKFSDFKINDATDTTKPLEAQMHFSGKLEYIDTKSTSPADFERGLTKALSGDELMLSLMPGVDSKAGVRGAPKQAAVDLGGPKEYSLALAITVPTAKVGPNTPPGAVHIADQDAEYDASTSWSGQTLHAKWSLNLRVPQVPEKDAKAYADFVQRVSESLSGAPPKLSTVPVTVVGSDKPSAPSISKGPLGTAGATGTVSAASANPTLPRRSDATAPSISVTVTPPSSEAIALLHQGQDEAKRQNWANAIQSFQSALKLAPSYADAWHELGRAYMSARRYSDAESAFREHVEFAPNSRQAYIDMAWVLYTEKKFSEEVQMLQERVASAPNDGDAHTRLGAAYLALHQPDKAVPELEKGISIYPRYEYAQYTLAQAYLQAGLNDKAVAAFTKAIELDDSDVRLNNAAYELAQKNCALDLAERWATKAVQTVELELNGITQDVPQNRASALVTKLSEDWDTLGWVKFQEKDYAAAEKYLTATWQLRKDTTPGLHLGRVYEAEGRKDEAVDMYAEAAEAAAPNGSVSDDEKEAHERMIALLGSQASEDKSLARPASKAKSNDSLAIPNPAAKQGIAQFRLTIGPDSKATEIQLLGADTTLADFSDRLRAATLPQYFPDDTLKQLLRVGTLACASPEQPCEFRLLPAAAAARVTD